MNQQGFLNAQHQIMEVLADYIKDSDDISIVIYGFDGDGKYGWHCVQTDYPDFTFLFMGESFEEAISTANEWAAEHAADVAADEADEYPEGEE